MEERLTDKEIEEIWNEYMKIQRELKKNEFKEMIDTVKEYENSEKKDDSN